MEAILVQVTPRALHAKLPVLAQFLRFGTVGVAGFLVDTATVYATRGALGLYGAGMVAYLTAATANWLLNRIGRSAARAPAPCIANGPPTSPSTCSASS